MSDMPCHITDGPQTPEDVPQVDGDIAYRNYYGCACGAEWDTLTATEDTHHCPDCNTSVSPYESEEIIY